MNVVVSDTSPVRALAHLGLVSLPVELFSSVKVPPAVVDELLLPPPTLIAVDVRIIEGYEIVAPLDRARVASLGANLDRGESEAIALALEVRADGVLMDDHAGRAEAKRLGLPAIGVVGLLHRAKMHGRVEAVLPLLDRLRDEAKFFVSDALREQAKRLCGE